MKKGKNHSLAIFFLLGASVIIFSGGCGTDKKEPIGTHGGQAATVGLDVCTACHSDQTGDWMTSGHANLASVSDLSSTGTPSYGDLSDSTCETCHDPLGDGQRLTADYTGDVPRPVVGCESCHGGGSEHYGGGPIGLLGSAASDDIGSSQFNTCTGCHELLNSDGTGTVVATHDASGSSPTTTANIITDSHFATDGIFTGGSGTNANIADIGGYVMDYTNERVCTNCHNPHKPPKANKEWARSAHADRTADGPWAHYNWSCDGTFSAGCGTSSGKPSSRRACQRCHTTSGFKAYADSLIADSEYIPSLAYDPNFKPEMLLCTGCHTDNRGRLRNPGAIVTDYSLSATGISSAASYTYPDVAGSNVCMACHTGRESGDTVKNVVFSDVSTTNFSKINFISSHYLAAGGTIFAATGYEYDEYDGRSYENPISYMHSLIGSSGAANTGTNGPCVGCHMSSSEKHLFLPVSRISSTNKTLTGVTSSVCEVCHTGGDPLVMSVEMLDNQKEQYEEALEALWSYLFRKGYYFYPGSPYFVQKKYNSGIVSLETDSNIITNITSTWSSTLIKAGDKFAVDISSDWYEIESVDSDTQITLSAPYTGPTATASYVILKSVSSTNVQKNWLSTGDDDYAGDTTGRKNLGAAFNYNLLEHDPGAYAHNRYYVKRLIYDAIDWLDDNILNYSVGDSLDDLDGVKYTFKAEAMHYLLPNGKTGNAVERP